MIVNDMRIMMKRRLLSCETADVRLAGKKSAGVDGVIPMLKTPYGDERGMVQSFLGVPCTNPTFGTMAAVDLSTKQVLWHRSGSRSGQDADCSGPSAQAAEPSPCSLTIKERSHAIAGSLLKRSCQNRLMAISGSLAGWRT